MQPQYIALSAIFGTQSRYTVPLFQRPYVWKKAEQWEPLWDDIQALADRVFRAKPEETVAGHFLGTAVLEQSSTVTGALPRREIIDGQQRLTTLQIILKAAQHALEIARVRADAEQLAGVEIGQEATSGIVDPNPFDVAARQIAYLTENPAFSSADEKYKVWPTNQDRDAFREVMDAGRGAQLSSTRMADAYRFFLAQMTGWLAADGSSRARAAALAAAIKDHLRLIVLDLDGNDEPQAIFETLNAHGTPLLPADLIKNWLIWEAANQRLKSQGLYEANWKQFDDDADYWRAIVGTGHAARARIDTFLQNWLTRRTISAVPPKHLYDTFLRHVSARPQVPGTPPCDLPALMEDIAADALQFRRIDQATGKTRFDIFLSRLKRFDFVVFQPVLMALMRRPASDQADLDAVGVALESWLLRRMICGEETRGYGTFALSLLEVLAEIDGGQPAAPAIVAHLAGPKGLGFPDDDAFKAAWTAKPFYGYFRRDRVLMILRAIEEREMAMTKLGEPIVSFNFDALQVEHILPQKWEEHWPLPDGGDRLHRDLRVHGIGNLTLVSDRLNPSLSNAPWQDWTAAGKLQPGKRAGLNKHSNLHLNRKIVSAHSETWDESCIDARALDLFEAARELWPRPAPSA
jgi:hypothetical protein